MKTMIITSRICSWTGTLIKNVVFPVMGHVFWSLLGLLHHLLKQVTDFQLKIKNGVSMTAAAPHHLWWLYWLAPWSSLTAMLRTLLNAQQSGLSKVPLLALGTALAKWPWLLCILETHSHNSHCSLERGITLSLKMTESTASSWLLQLIR